MMQLVQGPSKRPTTLSHAHNQSRVSSLCFVFDRFDRVHVSLSLLCFHRALSFSSSSSSSSSSSFAFFATRLGRAGARGVSEGIGLNGWPEFRMVRAVAAFSSPPTMASEISISFCFLLPACQVIASTSPDIRGNSPRRCYGGGGMVFANFATIHDR